MLRRPQINCEKGIAEQVETSVLIKNEELKPEDNTVFLGITLDAKLQWGPHIDKLSKNLGLQHTPLEKFVI